MRRPPRPRDEPLLTGELTWHIVPVSVLFLAAVIGIYAYAADRGYPPELAQTMALNTLVVLEMTWAAVRSTALVWMCVIAVTLAQFAVTYLSPLQAIFGTRPVALGDGLIIVAVGVVFFTLVETEKQMRLAFRRAPRRIG